MSNFLYNAFKSEAKRGAKFDKLKIMLVGSNYHPNPSDGTRADVIGEIREGEGYITGGQDIPEVEIIAEDCKVTLSGGNVTWENSSITASGAIIYQNTGKAATDLLIAFIDFETPQTSNEGDFAIEWDGSGILSLT